MHAIANRESSLKTGAKVRSLPSPPVGVRSSKECLDPRKTEDNCKAKLQGDAGGNPALTPPISYQLRDVESRSERLEHARASE